MRKGVATAVLAVCALFASGSPASAAPLPSDFFGVSSPDLMGLSVSAREPILSDQRAAGVRLLRQLFDWSAIEPTEGSYDWSATDSFMRSAAGADMKVLPVVLWSPKWASSCPDATNFQRCPPADYADFGNFVATLIGRYGPSGSFWPANPTVPKLPITSWQLWNEPALPAFWGGAPSPAQYVQMLQTAVPIIRAADPSAELVAAGIPDSFLPGAIRMSDYVSGMYAAGFKGLVDVLALHLYDDTPANAVGLVEQARATMNANGDSATQIWPTEFGWASAGKPNRFVTDLPGQAANLSALMSELVARHEELGIRGLAEYFWHDGSSQSSNTDVWNLHLGLVFQDYTHKPAYDAFQAVAIHTTPPDTSLDSAPAASVPPGPQTIAFSSSEPGSDFECRLDDAAWSACTSPLPIATLPAGTHSFAVRATDPYGNTDPTPAGAAWQVQAPAAAVEAATTVSRPPALGAGLRSLAKRLRKLDLARLARLKVLRLALSWPAAGRLSLTLRAHGIVIARGSRLVGHGGLAALELTLTARGRRLAAASRRLRVTASESLRTLGGLTVSGHTSVSLRRR
jgi:polysaccharide biosynthesis protein PslG